MIPTEWMQEPDPSWWMYLRCGSCGASREVVVSDAAAQRYDADLDRGMHEIAATVRRLEREQMAEQADALATALHLDLLDATDWTWILRRREPSMATDRSRRRARRPLS